MVWSPSNMLAAVCVVVAAIMWGAGGMEGTVDAGFRMDENASIEEWDKEAKRLSAERIALLDDLIRCLRSEQDTEKQGRICFLLGEYRHAGAVQDLSEHITLQLACPGEYTRLPLWGQYPAWEALVKIGLPATKPMIETLAVSEDALARRLSIQFFHEVYGPEISPVLLDKAIEKETDPKRKANLEAAREHFDQAE